MVATDAGQVAVHDVGGAPPASSDAGPTADPCQANPCMNGGQCSAQGQTYSCVCPPETHGAHCEHTGPATITWQRASVAHGPFGRQPSVHADGLGYLHAAWSSSYREVHSTWHATNQSGGWEDHRLLGQSRLSHWYPVVFGDADGYFHVLFRDLGRRDPLAYYSNHPEGGFRGNFDGGHTHELRLEIGSNHKARVFTEADTGSVVGSAVYLKNHNQPVLPGDLIAPSICSAGPRDGERCATDDFCRVDGPAFCSTAHAYCPSNGAPCTEHRHCPGGMCIGRETIHDFSTAIAPNDDLHFVIGYVAAGDPRRNIYYLHKAAGQPAWTEAVEIDGMEHHAWAPTMELDADGRLHVIFAADGDLQYVHGSATTWSAPVRITDAGELLDEQPSLTIDANRKVHVTWVRGETQLMYANNVAGSWSEPSLIEGNLSSEHTSITHTGDRVAVSAATNTVNVIFTQEDPQDPALSHTYIATTQDVNVRPNDVAATGTFAPAAGFTPPNAMAALGSSADVLSFAIHDDPADGMPTVLRQVFLHTGAAQTTTYAEPVAGEPTRLTLDQIIDVATLRSDDGSTLDGAKIDNALIFGNAGTDWVTIPNGGQATLTVAVQLPPSLPEHLRGTTMELRVDGAHDLRFAPSGGRLRDVSSVVSTGPIALPE